MNMQPADIKGISVTGSGIRISQLDLWSSVLA